MLEKMDDENEMLDVTQQNRKLAKKLARDAASRGDPLAGALADLENLAAPFFLDDGDSADLDVHP